MSFDQPPASQVAAAPPPPPMYAQDKKQGKGKQKSMQPTALAAGSVPEVTALGSKTLLGQ
jgi:hypothetical protein